MAEALSAPLHGAASNPRPVLEAAFQHIQATRMDGVPILNPRLAVEAVGLRRWQDHWLGVLITPWFMNILLLPGGGRWPSTAPGTQRDWIFPSGAYTFIAGFEPAVGEYQACSLFSPVLEFEHQEAARLTALAALEALLQPDPAGVAAGDPGTPGPVAAFTQNLGRPMSKRDFLTGAAFRSKP